MLQQYKLLFDDYLQNFLSTQKKPKTLYQPIEYFLNIGGKRLRPILALLSADIFSKKPKIALDISLALEIFHNFTLIHDDMMDNAPMRRGKETVHKKWGNNTALLSGDIMSILSHQILGRYEPILASKLTADFSKMAVEICEGQQMDLDFESRIDVSYIDYLEMIRKKTAVLPATAMKMGAMVNKNQTKETEQKAYEFGLNIGIAFQLQDDYLDTFGNEKLTGKFIGGDILTCKKTAFYTKALNSMNEANKQKLLSLYNSSLLPNHIKIEQVMSLYQSNKVDELVKKDIEKYTNLASKALDTMDIEEGKKTTLRNLGNLLVERKT